MPRIPILLALMLLALGLHGQGGVQPDTMPDHHLPTVLITAGVQRIFKDKTLHLYDYAFHNEGLVVILYDRDRRRPYLAWVDENGEIIDTESGIESPGKLERDCMGNVQVIGKEYACQLFITQDNNLAYFPENLEDYERTVGKCLDNLDGYYYYGRHRYNGQLLDYYHFNSASAEGKGFLQLADRRKMREFHDPEGQYAGMFPVNGSLKYVPDATWHEINTSNDEFQFYSHAFFYPIHAPLHALGEQLYVFDHTNDLLRVLEAEGKALDTIPIAYHKLPNWEKAIYVDRERAEAYTAYARNGYVTLREIDLNTGELVGKYELPYQFPQKIQVQDGVAYFMYKETNYDPTNRLYRLRLKD